jgi:hypothetical protein
MKIKNLLYFLFNIYYKPITATVPIVPNNEIARNNNICNITSLNLIITAVIMIIIYVLVNYIFSYLIDKNNKEYNY